MLEIDDVVKPVFDAVNEEIPLSVILGVPVMERRGEREEVTDLVLVTDADGLLDADDVPVGKEEKVAILSVALTDVVMQPETVTNIVGERVEDTVLTDGVAAALQVNDVLIVANDDWETEAVRTPDAVTEIVVLCVT